MFDTKWLKNNGVGICGILIAILTLRIGYLQYSLSKAETKILMQQTFATEAGNTLQSQSNALQDQGNKINEIIASYSKSQNDIAITSLDFMKNQTYFQTKQSLENSLSDPKYEFLKTKLYQKETIKIIAGLQNYLNNFEEVYMACHRGIVPKNDIKTSFEYLLGDVCSNSDVLMATKSGYGGLKKLCSIFFPRSKLASAANMDTNNCR